MKQTLTDDQITSRRRTGRRRFIGMLLGCGATSLTACVPAGPGGTVSVGTDPAVRTAPVYPSSRPTGFTDQDYAPTDGITDPPNYGRGPYNRYPAIPSWSDYDSGRYADQYRQPSGTGFCDYDGGPYADPYFYGSTFPCSG